LLPENETIGDASPWTLEELLVCFSDDEQLQPRRLIQPFLSGVMVVWSEEERDWGTEELELVGDFVAEMEPRLTREAMLSALVEGSDTVIFVKDRDGRYLEVNPSAARIIGLPREEVLGKTDFDIFPAEVARRLRGNDARVMQGEIVQKEETVPCPDGREFTSLSLKFPLKIAGTQFGVCGIGADITERTVLADKLLQTKERLDLALEGVGLGLWMCDLPLSELEWSDRCKQHFGLPPDAEITIELFYQLIHPEDREATRTALEKAIADGSLYDVIYRTVGLDGVTRWIHAIGRCFYDEHGNGTRIDGLTIDVSDTIQAEQALRLSERRYRSLVSATASVVWRADPDGVFHFRQEQWESFTGQHWEEYRGLGWLEAIHEDDREVLRESLEAAVNAKDVYKGSGRLWHADSQSYRHFEVRAVPVLESGTIKEWVGIVVDVHERVASERAALETQLRMRAALNQSVGFIGVLDPNGVLVEVNDTPLELAGIKRSDAIGRPFWETPWWVGHPADQEKLKQDFQAALAGPPVRTQTPYYLADGTERISDRCLTATKGPDGEVALVLAEGMDVTERVVAERNIRLLAKAGEMLSATLVEEEMLRNFSRAIIGEFAHLCILDRLVEGEIERVVWQVQNPDLEERVRRLLKFSPSIQSGHPSVKVLKTGEGVLKPHLAEGWLVELGLTEEHATAVLESGLCSLISVPVPGRERTIGALTLCLAHPTQRIFDEADYQVAGELSYRLGMALENARLYSEVSQSEKRFRQLSHELAEARDEALRANRMKSQFLANMSHEIRTPMVGVKGMLELLAGTDLSKEQQEFVSIVQDCSDSLLTVLDDVLDLARIDAGKVSVQNRPFRLASAIKGVLALFELQAEQRNLTLRVRVSEELPEVILADPDRLRQLLVNLVSNALKFTESGYIEIRFLQVDSATLRVEVEDSGIGIEPERIERLWEAFEQVDNTASRRYEGTGLGLSIVRRLVELMQGRVGADSTPGVGSTFWFEIPLISGALEPPESGAPRMSITNGQGRILVAEDNPINRRVLVKQLQGLGYQVTEARNGLEVLENVGESEYDLILMDCQMPEMDGYSATRELRKKGLELPILALTAHAMSGERARCLEAGMDDHLTKPLSRDGLAAALYRWLGGQSQKI
jgi:PAS domain S-box-containing protein